MPGAGARPAGRLQRRCNSPGGPSEPTRLEDERHHPEESVVPGRPALGSGGVPGRPALGRAARRQPRRTGTLSTRRCLGRPRLCEAAPDRRAP